MPRKGQDATGFLPNIGGRRDILCKIKINERLMENVTGADFKSATADGNKKLFIETYGCQMNVADSEVIASVMQMAGYSVADTPATMPNRKS